MGKDCIVAFEECHAKSTKGLRKKDFECGKHEFTCSSKTSLSYVSARGLRVIGSSEQVHVVDALAITGDEGRRSLR